MIAGRRSATPPNGMVPPWWALDPREMKQNQGNVSLILIGQAFSGVALP